MALDLTGLVLDNIALSKIDAPLGTYRQSDLTEAQFNEISLGTWALCDGRSCSNSAYELLTGKANVPNATIEGTFFRQAKTGRELGSYEADAFQGHWHDMGGNFDANNDVQAPPAHRITATGQNNHSDPASTTLIAQKNVRNPSSDGVNGTPRTANETRSKNLAANFFIKIGY